jgi:uncharacterized protein (UPF0335 family)
VINYLINRGNHFYLRKQNHLRLFSLPSAYIFWENLLTTEEERTESVDLLEDAFNKTKSMGFDVKKSNMSSNFAKKIRKSWRRKKAYLNYTEELWVYKVLE